MRHFILLMQLFNLFSQCAGGTFMQDGFVCGKLKPGVACHGITTQQPSVEECALIAILATGQENTAMFSFDNVTSVCSYPTRFTSEHSDCAEEKESTDAFMCKACVDDDDLMQEKQKVDWSCEDMASNNLCGQASPDGLSIVSQYCALSCTNCADDSFWGSSLESIADSSRTVLCTTVLFSVFVMNYKWIWSKLKGCLQKVRRLQGLLNADDEQPPQQQPADVENVNAEELL